MLLDSIFFKFAAFGVIDVIKTDKVVIFRGTYYAKYYSLGQFLLHEEKMQNEGAGEK